MSKFTIIKDTREQQGWDFSPSKYCAGSKAATVATGDYSVEGLENIISIERKKSTSEVASNIYSKRFIRELVRAKDIPHFFIVCEFTLDDLYNFPYGSGIPKPIWKKLRINSKTLVKRIFELEITYNVNFIFAGDKAREITFILLKQAAANNGII